MVDNKLSHAQSAIGTSSNIAQLAQTYMYNFDDKKYKDYVCILSVLAQVAIDSAKRAFDIDIVTEIERIKNDMEVNKNGYPLFWKHVKDKKTKIGDKKFNAEKINKELICPMNYLMNLKFKNSRSGESTLPMSYFFNKFELKEDRRMSKKVEKLIEKYSFELYDFRSDSDSNYIDYLLLRSNFDEMIEDIRQTYISKDYLGLMSWLIDRAFMITNYSKGHKMETSSNLNKNKSLLLKTLYDVNQKNLLLIFSKNVV